MSESMSTWHPDDRMVHRVREVLFEIPILARRLVLETASDEAEVPRLRGVWGAALHAGDRGTYDRVFHPQEKEALPGYILRPLMPSPRHQPEFHFILIGPSVCFDESVLRAWDIASGMGLGKQRTPFYVRDRSRLSPDGQSSAECGDWSLGELSWPLGVDAESTPCRIRSVTPLSLQRNKQLIERPTIKDVVAKSCRRIGSFLPRPALKRWESLKAALIEYSSEVAATDWQPEGFAQVSDTERVQIKRYSASQDQEYATPGVCGRIDLPQGPGPLWPLLAALQWLHTGKSATVGLGWLAVEHPLSRVGKKRRDG